MLINKYSKIFEPIKIGDVEIKNRIAMAPMGIFGMVTLQGAFSQRAIDYYVERAKGGTGLIITAMVKVENTIEKWPMPSNLCISENPMHFVQTASYMTERLHYYGAKVFIQLTAGCGRVSPTHRILTVPVAPSAIPHLRDPNLICRELTVAEIEKLIQKFGEAAEIAVTAGFDGIEVHAVHEGYLLDQFATALFNKRRDKFGGDLRGRLTLPIKILEEIKGKVGEGFPVQLRYSIKHFIKDFCQGGLLEEEFKEAGRDTAEGLQAAQILEEAGYDSFNADAGSYDSWYWSHPPNYQEHGCYLPLTQKLKEVVKVPVIVAGRMDSPDLALSAITDGKADMIALGRGLLAEPQWPDKVLKGEIKNIRPCLACHDGCLGRGMITRPLSCAVNPSCGNEREYSIHKADNLIKVMVIGGGVAGMEAARVASIRGHKVSLYEKTDNLGGHLIEGSVPSFKADVFKLLNWYKTQLSEMGVEIHFNQEVTPERVYQGKPDCLIVATGSKWAFPNIQGIDNEIVVTASDLLLGKKKAKEPILIIGGGLIGCETALWLAQSGKDVTIVEMLGGLMQAGISVPVMNKTMMLDLLKYYGVNILTDTQVSKITDDVVKTIDKYGRKNDIQIGMVVIATGLQSDRQFLKAFGANMPNTYYVGDTKQVRNIMNAIWESYEIVRNI